MNNDAESRTWDCIVVGAGPAGLNAALLLGRARRRVLVLDNAQPRNYAAHEMHAVLSHDGLDPADLPARGRAELGRYGVEAVTSEVRDAGVLDGVVRLTSGRGADLTRTVLLATGMLDEVPDIPGFVDVWGTSARTCPYCDGFEHRDERLAVLAAGHRDEHLAVLLRQWSDDVVLLSNGPHDLAADQPARVRALGIPISETPIIALDGDDTGRFRRVPSRQRRDARPRRPVFYVGWRLRIDVARTAAVAETMRECAELGIKHVWMHRSFGAGSVSDTATEYGREHGITVIDGGCPCMFDPTADVGHKAMRFVFTLNGHIPRQVA